MALTPPVVRASGPPAVIRRHPQGGRVSCGEGGRVVQLLDGLQYFFAQHVTVFRSPQHWSSSKVYTKYDTIALRFFVAMKS